MLAVSDKRNALLLRMDEVLVALRRVIRATDLHSRHLAKTTGLTSPQILLLQTIRDQGQVTIGELATDISLSQATVTSILDRLEKRELVYRERSRTDKRKVHAHLTVAGIEVLKHVPLPLQEHFTREFGALQEWEQAMMIASLQRLAGMMDKGQLKESQVLDIALLKDADTLGGDRLDAGPQ